MKKAIILIIAVIVVLVLTACGGAAKNKETDSAVSEAESTARTVQEESQTDAGEEAEAAPSYYFFENGVLVSKDVKLVIKDYQVLLPGEVGNENGESPVIAFWYDTTNLSDKEGVTALIAWHAMFRVYQDNNPDYYNELVEAPSPDSSLAETGSAAIKKNGTVSNAIAFSLDDLTTPVLIKAERGSTGEYLGEQEYSIAEKTTTDTGVDSSEIENDAATGPESEQDPEPEPEQEAEPEPVLTADGLRIEFKEAMDAYESFYDEYCALMKEYKDNPTSTSILGKYSDFMEKAEEVDEKFDAWENDDLNDAELKYYMDVNNRVIQKLLSAQSYEPVRELEPEPEQEPEPASEPIPNLTADGLRPEFKEAMDAYEAFYDEYCEFMKEYKENPTNLSLLGKYADFLEQVDEMDEKFDAWDGDTLNDAEMKYYWEVYNRVMQKITSIYG